MKAEKLGLAQAHDANASYKDLTQVCNAIRRQPLDKAKKMLEDAINLVRAIPYRKFNKGMGHRSELGGRKGRYPKKECKIVLQLVKNAEANAVQKGLEKGLLYVKHAAAYKQNVFRRYRKYWAGGQTLGYGKQAVWADYVTARVEIALAQHGGKKQEQATAPTEKHAVKQKKEKHAENPTTPKAHHEAKPAAKAHEHEAHTPREAKEHKHTAAHPTRHEGTEHAHTHPHGGKHDDKQEKEHKHVEHDKHETKQTA